MNVKSQHQLATPRGLVNFYLDQLYIMKKKGIGARMPSGSMITEGAIRVTLERLKELSLRHNYKETSLDDIDMYFANLFIKMEDEE
jgi:hypothetical protein